ncbi:C-C chemokine receptor type 5-like [Discoglossus pictus]
MNLTTVYDEQYTSTDYSSYDGEVCNKEDIKEKAARFISPVYILVFVVGFIGNSLVVLILIKYKKLRNMTDIYLLNLAISDLLFVFSLPFWAYSIVYDWVFGNALCKLLSGLYLIGFYGGSFFIILLTLDRYLAIVHAIYSMKARTIKFGVITSSVLWGIAVFASLPGFIFHKASRQGQINTCSPFYPEGSESHWKQFCTFKMNILGLIIPFIIMVFCYTRIICTLLRSRNEKKKHKAVRLIFIIMIVFFLFWTPYNIVLIMYSFQNTALLNDCATSKRLYEAIQWTEVISYLHCCLNPIIYAFVGEKFRKYLCTVLKNILPNWYFCPLSSTAHMPIGERHSSMYTTSTGEHDISAVL